MAKQRPEKKPEPASAPPTTRRVLPMDLQVGDRLTDESGEWEVIGRPYTTAGGKAAHARVRLVAQPTVTEVRTWVHTSRSAVGGRGGRPMTTLFTIRVLVLTFMLTGCAATRASTAVPVEGQKWQKLRSALQAIRVVATAGGRTGSPTACRR